MPKSFLHRFPVFRFAPGLAAATALLALLPLGLLAQNGAEDGEESALIVGDRAYLFETPWMIAPASVIRKDVSPDGRHVLVFHTTLPLEKMRVSAPANLSLPRQHSLTLTQFDTRTGRTRDLKTWGGNETVMRYPAGLQWLGDGDTALVRTSLSSVMPGRPCRPFPCKRHNRSSR